MKPDYKLVAKAKYIHMTADLASEVWHEVYKRYFPAKQLDALIENLQSADSIEEDIDNDVNYFLVVLGGKAGAASGAASMPRPCRCSSSSRPGATAPSALPRVRAASSATS